MASHIGGASEGWIRDAVEACNVVVIDKTPESDVDLKPLSSNRMRTLTFTTSVLIFVSLLGGNGILDIESSHSIILLKATKDLIQQRLKIATYTRP